MFNSFCQYLVFVWYFSEFSKLLYLKNNYISRLDTENELRMKISSIHPDVDILVVNNQLQQFSH